MTRVPSVPHREPVLPGVDLVDLIVQAYEAEARGESAIAEERLREILPMLVFEMQHSIDHYNICAKRVLVHRGVLDQAGLRAPAAAPSDVSRALLDRYLAGLQLDAGAVRVD